MENLEVTEKLKEENQKLSVALPTTGLPDPHSGVCHSGHFILFLLFWTYVTSGFQGDSVFLENVILYGPVGGAVKYPLSQVCLAPGLGVMWRWWGHGGERPRP